jgi:phage replication-related protein YjqB (UPF0714/DUF867 family)
MFIPLLTLVYSCYAYWLQTKTKRYVKHLLSPYFDESVMEDCHMTNIIMIFHPYVLTKLEKEYAIRNLQVMMQINSHIQEAIWKIILLS